jgi:putative transposase
MSRPPRLAQFGYVGRFTYFLTFCAFERRDLCRDRSAVELVSAQILRTASEFGFAVIAYCFMPDHVHLLVAGTTASANLRAFVKLARQRAGSLYVRANHQHLWQRGYHDRVLRSSDDVHRFVKYIVDNPVRAGLVQRAEDYPYVWKSNNL